MVLYWQLKRLYIAFFDDAGVMRTELDRMLTQEETDAKFEYCRDESDNISLFGRGTIDYFWKLDPSGKVIDERRGRWLRDQTPGFLCQLVNPTTMLLVWGTHGLGGRAGHSRTVRSLKFDLTSFSGGAPREHDLSKVAEAREAGIALAQAHLIRSGRDLLLFVSASDSASETTTYRVRFNARGDPVRRWEMKRIYHLQAETPGEGHCNYRTAVLLKRRSGPQSLDLQGIGSDGNIHRLTGRVPALRAR
jgi:hypothetical protein